MSISIRNNLQFVNYSDGLTDLKNQPGRQFGQERVEARIKEHYSEYAGTFIATVEKQIDEFQGEAPQADDITGMTLQC